MTRTIRQRVTIRRTGRLEVQDPALLAGDTAEVIVYLEHAKAEGQDESDALVRFIGSGRGVYATPEEADAFIRSLRDEWD